MFEKLEIMHMAKDMALHAAARQAQVASNVANADTPGYKASDLPGFSKIYTSSRSAPDLLRTRPGHIGGFDAPPRHDTVVDASVEPSPNGNTVSLETELVRSASAKRQHEISISIYRSSLDLLRSTLGRGR